MYGKSSTVPDVFKTLLVLAFLICSCMAASLSPQVDNQTDLNKLEGSWRLVAGIPPSKQGLSKNVEIEYTMSLENLHIEFNGISAISNRPITFISDVPTNNMTAKWYLLDPASTIGPVKHEFPVIEESYAVMILHKLDNTNPHAAILSREKWLNEDKLEELKNMVAESLHVDRSKIVNVEQDNLDQLSHEGDSSLPHECRVE